MAYQHVPTKSSRTFVVYAAPHVADPAFVSPVVELKEDGTYIGYNDAEELLKVYLQIRESIAEQAGFSAGLKYARDRERNNGYPEIDNYIPRDVVQALADEVVAELNRARTLFPKMQNSMHEGFAVMDEERDECWEHVKVNQKKRDYPAARKEFIQVAAMAMRTILEVIDTENRI